jgi:hypothetical protein
MLPFLTGGIAGTAGVMLTLVDPRIDGGRGRKRAACEWDPGVVLTLLDSSPDGRVLRRQTQFGDLPHGEFGVLRASKSGQQSAGRGLRKVAGPVMDDDPLPMGSCTEQANCGRNEGITYLRTGGLTRQHAE